MIENDKVAVPGRLSDIHRQLAHCHFVGIHGRKISWVAEIIDDKDETPESRESGIPLNEAEYKVIMRWRRLRWIFYAR